MSLERTGRGMPPSAANMTCSVTSLVVNAADAADATTRTARYAESESTLVKSVYNARHRRLVSEFSLWKSKRVGSFVS